MFNTSINFIVNELNNYILPKDGIEVVVAGNIAFMENEESSAFLRNKIVVSLINIEEESTLKNGKNFVFEGTSIKYYHRPVHLNLYVLFAANFLGGQYVNGLANLSRVVEYFQSHKVITHLNAPGSNPDETTPFELYMDLFALTFEQVNYVWGSLGGKQVPFVLYKGRLVTITADKTLKGTGVVEQVNENGNPY